MVKIIEKKVIGKNVTHMTIDAPYIARKALAGQFVILRVDKEGERIPLTIFKANKNEGTIEIIYQVVGTTTMKLDLKQNGDFIEDIVGPLGKPTEVKGYKRVIVVSGGVGSAIAYPLAKAFKENGSKTEIVVGFRSKDYIILEDDMKLIDKNIEVVTDDGSNGKKALVTASLEEKLKNSSNYDLVVAVGPIPMMKAVCDITRKYNVKTIVSMTAIMIDGTGMCGGCRLTVGGKVKFACIDGPDFDGHLVDFEEASFRSKAFLEEEKISREKNCNLFKGV